jgi:regulator of sigma E protease
MTIVLFAIILGILVLVHELGHFLAAKKAGVRVDEFGFGYPPRAWIIGKKWGTLFTLNWLPFGGFVKIYGENYENEQTKEDQQKNDSQKVLGSPLDKLGAQPDIFSNHFSAGISFSNISKKWQAAILAGGVVFNMLFAWFLFSLGFVVGIPTPVENDFGAQVRDPKLTVISVIPDSPAENVGIKSGDKIINLSSQGVVLDSPSTDDVSRFINDSVGEVELAVMRGDQKIEFTVKPEDGLIEGKRVVGISMDMVGTLSLPLHKSVIEGFRATYKITYLTVDGLLTLIKDAFRGRADISGVSGPVGIVGLVGDASRLGFAYLVTFTALISINLAIINLVPFPALDGGRLVFVAVESIIRKKINPIVAQVLNTLGFVILIALMLIVTYRDILKLF